MGENYISKNEMQSWKLHAYFGVVLMDGLFFDRALQEVFKSQTNMRMVMRSLLELWHQQNQYNQQKADLKGTWFNPLSLSPPTLAVMMRSLLEYNQQKADLHNCPELCLSATNLL